MEQLAYRLGHRLGLPVGVEVSIMFIYKDFRSTPAQVTLGRFELIGFIGQGR